MPSPEVQSTVSDIFFVLFCTGLVSKSTRQVPTSREDGLTVDESQRKLPTQLTGRLAGVADVITHLRQLQQHRYAAAVHGTLDGVITGSVTADVTAWLPGNNQRLPWIYGGSCCGCARACCKLRGMFDDDDDDSLARNDCSRSENVRSRSRYERSRVIRLRIFTDMWRSSYIISGTTGVQSTISAV